MKVKFCDICQHKVTILFHSRKANRQSCCPKCYRPEQSITRKEKVSENGLNKAREVKKYVIPKVGEKQAKINALYSVLRKQYLKDHPNCQVKLRVCSGKATEIHHTHFGSDKRTHFLDSSTFKSICRHCHRFIHDEMSSKEQRERGLKIN